MPSPALPRHRVLVVDDNADTAQALAALLRELGQTAYQATDGRAALILAARHKPDLALIDIVMPRMDGFELAAALRDLTGLDSTRLVAITGYPGEPLRAMTAATEFDASLTKPVVVDDLVKLLAAP